jgi:16S rRNA (guanine527-N7)-methyltransferase
MIERSSSLSTILAERWPDLPAETRAQLVRFYELVLEGNAKQNLTRIVDSAAFFEDNLRDSEELVKSGYLGKTVLDLGSGAGLPGIPCAILEQSTSWTLNDAEKSKAAFLKETALALTLNLKVSSERAEKLLERAQFETVCARAVGKVEKIFGWIGNCSTWNNLVLLKGPAWEQEWAEFQASKHRGKLKINAMREYSVGADLKRRLLVNLIREK